MRPHWHPPPNVTSSGRAVVAVPGGEVAALSPWAACSSSWIFGSTISLHSTHRFAHSQLQHSQSLSLVLYKHAYYIAPYERHPGLSDKRRLPPDAPTLRRSRAPDRRDARAVAHAYQPSLNNTSDA